MKTSSTRRPNCTHTSSKLIKLLDCFKVASLPILSSNFSGRVIDP